MPNSIDTPSVPVTPKTRKPLPKLPKHQVRLSEKVWNQASRYYNIRDAVVENTSSYKILDLRMLPFGTRFALRQWAENSNQAIAGLSSFSVFDFGDPETTKAWSLTSAESLVIAYTLRNSASRWARYTTDLKATDTYYIQSVTVNSSFFVAPHVQLLLQKQTVTGPVQELVRIFSDAVMGRTASQILEKAGIVILSDSEITATNTYYEENSAILTKVGTLMETTKALFGDASYMDGNNLSFFAPKHYALDLGAKVILDVAHEQSDNYDNDVENNLGWWDSVTDTKSPTDDEATTCGTGVRPQSLDLPVFSFAHGLRFLIPFDAAKPYVYDVNAGPKIVIPDNHRAIIAKTLSLTQSKFKDVVSGKGNSHVILCAGLPGTGKTLTAETYSEIMQRPLYSVQCSQLGTDTDTIEESLAKTFHRASRWNAILLIDEADVYVRARGEDIQQNAIVGVFLRTLEYYNGVMFLTTNRAETMDDAILSRCMIKLKYDLPTKADKVRIWNILAAENGYVVDWVPENSEVNTFLTAPKSGRDIKTLMKLAILCNDRGDNIITHDDVSNASHYAIL